MYSQSITKQGASSEKEGDMPLNSSYADGVNFGVKRCFDLLVGVTATIIFLPVMAVIAVLVKMTSPGPVLFKQERVGKDEKVFNICKFRTMVNDAEKNTGPVWTTGVDNRVTPLGRILRLTHLDELPQLFNVLKGDMAIVGPRPERPCFVIKFKNDGIENYEQRHSVKGGITGYAQIRCPYPSIEQIGEKTEADLHYIQNWSLWLDIVITWETFLHFLGAFVDLFKKQDPSESQEN